MIWLEPRCTATSPKHLEPASFARSDGLNFRRYNAAATSSSSCTPIRLRVTARNLLHHLTASILHYCTSPAPVFASHRPADLQGSRGREKSQPSITCTPATSTNPYRKRNPFNDGKRGTLVRPDFRERRKPLPTPVAVLWDKPMAQHLFFKRVATAKMSLR
jgi:hypothetical protein